MTPIVRTTPRLAGPHILGGLSTRVGFPPGDASPPENGRAEVRATLAQALGRPPDRFAWCQQIHGTEVRRAEKPGLQGEGDALVSTDPALVLLVTVADCCPVLLWDTKSPAVAVAHAGWRGVLAGVVRATCAGLVDAGATLSSVRAWIGPSIGVEHFEVGEEVATKFPGEFVHRRDDWDRPHVALKEMVAASLQSAGLRSKHIEACEDDTYGRPDLYFSYRRDGGICGRHLGYLGRLSST